MYINMYISAPFSEHDCDICLCELEDRVHVGDEYIHMYIYIYIYMYINMYISAPFSKHDCDICLCELEDWAHGGDVDERLGLDSAEYWPEHQL